MHEQHERPTRAGTGVSLHFPQGSQGSRDERSSQAEVVEVADRAEEQHEHDEQAEEKDFVRSGVPGPTTRRQ